MKENWEEYQSYVIRNTESCLRRQQQSNMSEMMSLCCCRGLEDMLGGACSKFGYMDVCGVLHFLTEMHSWLYTGGMENSHFPIVHFHPLLF